LLASSKIDVDDIDVNATYYNGETPLYAACTGGFERCAQILLNDDGIDVNRTDLSGCSALCVAARHGRVNDADVVEALLGADVRAIVNKVNDDGMTALESAAQRRSNRVPTLLALDRILLTSDDLNVIHLQTESS
jgi:ankyrin repeat protein